MKYLEILEVYDLTDKELIKYRKELLFHKTDLETELKYTCRSSIAEVEDELKKRIRRIEHDLAIAQHDRENCNSSGYNEVLLSIN